MRYLVLATDYDGTLAWDGKVSVPTFEALVRLRASGRKLVLVTGREVRDLIEVFPELDVFDAVVGENGCVLYRPASRETRLLALPPPPPFIEQLRLRGINPLNVGQVIVSTRQPNEKVVLDVIRDLGLELHVVFNKGAVMVLPSGHNKGVGLEAALVEFGWSLHNCVALGDAENDHAMLVKSECSVAVANAVPALRDIAEWVTESSNGAGVVEVIERLLEDDLKTLAPRLERHRILLGARSDGSELMLDPHDTTVLVAGASGSGKSRVAASVLQRLFEQGYQACVIDPEGDYEGLEGAVILGTPTQPPELEAILHVLDSPKVQLVVNLLGLALAERPPFFLALSARLREFRAQTGRPHWLLVDEAHHMLHRDLGKINLPDELGSLLLITVHVERLPRALLEQVNHLLAVGPDSPATVRTFAETLGTSQPRLLEVPLRYGQILAWHRGEAAVEMIELRPDKQERRRHRRKYAQGELGADKSFYFRGPDARLNLRAQNLVIFNQLIEGIDEETWMFHLERGDYSSWLRSAIKDEELADEVAEIEQRADTESRRAVREAIERRYTLGT